MTTIEELTVAEQQARTKHRSAQLQLEIAQLPERKRQLEEQIAQLPAREKQLRDEIDRLVETSG